MLAASTEVLPLQLPVLVVMVMLPPPLLMMTMVMMVKVWTVVIKRVARSAVDEVLG